MGLMVAAVGPSKVPVDRSDEYLPLSIDFDPGQECVDSIYYLVEERYGGANEGYVELKVEPSSGGILGVVAITKPRTGCDVPPFGNDGLPIAEGLARVDVSKWSALKGERDPHVNFVRERSSLAFGENDTSVYLSLSPVAPVKWLVSGFVGFGVGADGELTGVISNKTI
ncbi:hypothetical protein [Amycolatopsis anabasis]|uniref:hypothetical protein n=1 Tax=Amycolatopsis anabasis TaxID=1840409 RepID=UPI00131A8C6C|nr:hypothetical protein [Amycolatopsis anabasis]